MTHIVVDGECGVLRAAHFTVFVAFTETVRARSVAEFRRLRKEFCRILIVNKHDVVDTPFMEEREFVERVGKLGSSVLGGPLEPFNTFLWPFRHAEFAVEFGETEPVKGTGVGRCCGLAVKLNCLGRLSSAAPAILAACTGAVCGIRVAVLSSEDEEGKGTVKVLAVLVGPNAIRVAVSEEVLGGHVSTVSIALEE